MNGVDFLEARAPDGIRLYAIGDVHGRLDLIKRMHELIEQDLATTRPKDWRIVHLGDYVDRGPNSKGVLDFLIRRTEEDGRVLALAGNHDIGFLDFLDRPDINSLFVNYGGDATTRSYGVGPDFRDRERLAFSHAALQRAVSDDHRYFLEDLPLFVEFGDFYFCHAGIRPGVALDAQRPEDLLWIRERFLNYPHLHPKVIVHGHTPHAEPQVLSNRVNVDTLAYHSGVLTALAVDGADKRLIFATN